MQILVEKIFPIEHKLFYLQFEEWKKTLSEYIKTKEGIYKVFTGKEICRFKNKDHEGILYIGKGVVFKSNNRIGKLINALNKTENNQHKGGVRMGEIIKENIHTTKIKIQIVENAKEYETLLLNEYLTNFGELPPFNHILN